MAFLVSVVVAAIKASVSLLSGSKFLIYIPTMIATLAYFNYELFDPENRPVIVKNFYKEYDFVVVGAGGAGAVLANRLTEIPNWSVLILEAGGHETEISDVPLLSLYLHKSRLDWRYRTQPGNTACLAMKDRRCCWTRGKVLGGSTVLNTMLYIRGNRRDFDQWESLGNTGWGYKDVLPYFIKSEDQRNPYLAQNTRYHGTGGYLTIQDSPYNTPLGLAYLQAGQEMGYELRDVNGEFQTGFAFYQFTMRRGTRCSTAKAFLRPVRLRKNLHVSIWSQATRVLIHPETRRAYGVEFLRDGRKHVVYARKEVILSAGAINSPQLLMLSGVGPARTLQKYDIPVIHDSPYVGQNLQDHIAVGGIVFLIDQPFSLVFRRLVNLNTALRYAIFEDGPLTSSVGLESVGFITTKYGNQTDDWPDIEFMITSSATNSDGGDQVKKAHGLTDKFYEENFASINFRDVFGVFPMILRPKSRGYMTIQSKDPLRYPLMYHNYLTHPDDVRVLREGVKQAIAFGQTSSMRRLGAKFHQTPVYGCRHLQQFTDEYWECVIRQYTLTIYHMSGTARMGAPNDPTAVVDPRLRVYGISNLRVIDASIMPRITSGNIQAPVIMIGEKGADLVKEDWLFNYNRARRSTYDENIQHENENNNNNNNKSERGSSPVGEKTVGKPDCSFEEYISNITKILGKQFLFPNFDFDNVTKLR
ncbi:glucose dehydrogenase precursor, putative [Pediculus humanus corporis]|uniref:Glucose dehydrogenase, putative n=1 Tax=Pediculus humanus subsp. corporis TaxID=121224 RepID=E0VUA9_PEDHC|nr:glucose dehydrogenase precursor, putative [Pediculus humanus corporis]EEB16965.1 glucose dehydrogenase precursor, putative [Pediculus humanus corporis]